MQFMMNKYANAGNQIKDIADILKKLNKGIDVPINNRKNKQIESDEDDDIALIKKTSSV